MGFARTFLVGSLATLTPVAALAVNDPRLKYKTLDTAHFSINYYGDLEPIARHILGAAEGAHERLSPLLGWTPSEKTHILITDFTDSANGSATPLPFNQVNLFLTAPDDLSPLGDVDDWYLELITHEYTHILHTDAVRGLPALFNRVLGKTLVPNQVQPRWLLEGLAVLEESQRTSGGRLRSSTWNMFLRADVLEQNIAPLDQFSNIPRRWPQANLWYLYGSFFLKWIASTYGEATLRQVIADYSREPIPFGINRSLKRAVGKTFEDLYPFWIKHLQALFGAQAAAIRKKGVVEGKRLTFAGNSAYKPRWIPQATGHEGEALLYYRDDGHRTTGFYRVDLKRTPSGEFTADKPTVALRVAGLPTASFGPDGTLFFSSVEIYSNLFGYNDLFSLEAGKTEPRGIEGDRKQLTHGYRASDVDVSKDGTQVTFVTNHHGTSTVQVAPLSSDGTIGKPRPLVKHEPLGQSFSPRWSPDGTHIVYSAWKYGGMRDIRYVDVATGTFVEVTSDRAIDSGPSFSPDGKSVFFHSDRTGVSNIYAWDIAQNKTYAVTNSLLGAFQPEPSPTGKDLAYLGYTSKGYDVFVMPLDHTKWVPAEDVDVARPQHPTMGRPAHGQAREYNALRTFYPRAITLDTAPGNFGQAVSVGVRARDIAHFHTATASVRVETENPTPQLSLNYGYMRLPFDVGVRASTAIVPRDDFRLGERKVPWVENQFTFSTDLVYSRPRALEGQQFAVSYSGTQYSGNLDAQGRGLDPYEMPSIPRRGFIGSLHFGWSYSNVESYLWSTGPEKGFTASANVNITDKWLASDLNGVTADASIATYAKMPWLSHHTLALRAAGGTSAGDLANRSPFYVGGFVDVPIVDVLRNSIIQGGFALRGYPTVVQQGSQYALFNAEYRFPIVNIDRGPSTLPLFLNRLSGALFVDYGSAFDDATSAKFKTGAGAELWFDTMLAYYLSFQFRLGYARGLASEGIDKAYFIAAVPY